MEAEFGDAVDITVLEDIPEGSDSQRVFEDLAAREQADIRKLAWGSDAGRRRELP